MPITVQVMAGRLYDAAYEAGRNEGYRQGVDAVAEKEKDIYKAMYDQGVKDANHRGSAAFTVAACLVLHKLYGFGKSRLRRVADAIGDELIRMLDPADAVRQVRQWGIHIDYDDELAGEIDGWEEMS